MARIRGVNIFTGLGFSLTGFITIALQSCTGFLQPEPIDAATLAAPKGFQVSPATSQHETTYKNAAEVSIRCGDAAAYIRNADKPQANNNGWLSCESGNFAKTFELAPGNNVIDIWFKSGTGTVSDTPSHVEFYRAEYVTIEDQAPQAYAGHGGDFEASGFGSAMQVLKSGNVLDVNILYETPGADPYDNTGVIYLYTADMSKVIAAYYGVGGYSISSSVTEVSAERFVISGTFRFADSTVATGSFLMNSVDGSRVAILSNSTESETAIAVGGSNFLLTNPYAAINGNNNAGYAKLMSTANGALIQTYEGQSESAYLGQNVQLLKNGNFVLLAPYSDHLGVAHAGYFQLFDGGTGVSLSSAFSGTEPDDNFGSTFAELKNGTIVVGNPNASKRIDVSTVEAHAGSIYFINSAGNQIALVESTNADEQLGLGVFALTNGNVVVNNTTGRYNSNTAGLVNLYRPDGSLISSEAGANGADYLGQNISALKNGNFVVGSPSYQIGAVLNAGAVGLRSGSTGNRIGSDVYGDDDGDRLGISVAELANGNIVVSNPETVGVMQNLGKVQLLNGVDFSPIGTPLVGQTENDRLGVSYNPAKPQTVPLKNGNYLIWASDYTNVDKGLASAGFLALVDGTTGAIIGQPWMGTSENERLGEMHGIELNDQQYVFSSPGATVNGVTEAGTLIHFNMVTGLETRPRVVGIEAYDRLGSDPESIDPHLYVLNNGDLLVGSPGAPHNGLDQSGWLIRVLEN